MDAQTKTLKVPGAVIYHEVRGSGPLLILISGGPTDADIMKGLATLLADHYTVVAYDPRGNSRSIFDAVPVEQSLDVHGDDLAALVKSFSAGPALIFGNSGGAQIGLNFAARYPALLRRLVAHEPPCISLLPDATSVLKQMRDVVEMYHARGAAPAMGEFLRIVGMPAPPRPPSPSPRLQANLDYFLEFGVKPISEYKPDLAALKSVDVIVAAGRESEGQLAFRTARALADALGKKLVLFPNGHSDWARDPREFSETLLTVLQDAR